MEKELSRRNFLGIAAVAGFAAASTGLAGCASGATTSNSAAATAAVDSANAAETDWLGSAPSIAASEIMDTKETDILIVGAGNGGMVAAATASDLGANFMVCEKMSSVGATRYDVGAVNSKWTQAAGTPVDEKRLLNELARYSSFVSDQRVQRVWIRESAEMVEWLDGIIAPLGASCSLDIEHGGDGGAGGTMYYMPNEKHGWNYATVPEGAKFPFVVRNEVLEKYIGDKGYTIDYGYDLVELVKDGARVSGAIFKTDDGYVQVNAKKGVIIATGGYQADANMVKSLNPIIPACCTAEGFNPQNTGVGIKAGLWAGGSMDPLPASMIFDRGAVAPGVDAGYDGDHMRGTVSQLNIGSQPFLKVDRDGRRIANESCNYDAICHAAANKKGGVWCQIFDVNAPDDVQRFQTQGCSAMTRNMQLRGKTVDEAYGEQYINTGIMMKADTLDELAGKLGFEGEAKKTFLAEVDRYNSLYDAQDDEDFGKETYRLSAIRTAPFYGCWYGGSLLTTLDGLRINENMQVLAADGSVVEGLFAAGDCSGSFYSGNYPVYIVGDACGRTLTFGRHAVRYICGDIA